MNLLILIIFLTVGVTLAGLFIFMFHKEFKEQNYKRNVVINKIKKHYKIIENLTSLHKQATDDKIMKVLNNRIKYEYKQISNLLKYAIKHDDGLIQLIVKGVII